MAAPHVPTLAEAASIVERHTGGRVVHIERQLRWRPTWFVDVERDGETIPLVLRGDRTDSEAFPLRHEHTFHRLMQERGFPVPHLLGYLETPGTIDAVLMVRVAGQPHFQGVTDADRDRVVDEYLQQLARLHRTDPAPFIAAGIVHPGPGDDTGMAGHRNMERRYRERKRQADPFAEFCLGWHHRHLPEGHGRLAPCVWDSGQFHHTDGHLVAIIDLEFGHVGDPLGDITIWRMRDTLIPFGDMGRLYGRYEELTGEPVDLEAVKRHHFAACMGNQLQFGAAVAAPGPETDLMTFMQWNSETNLMATDFLGEYLAIELPSVEVPETRRGRDDATFGQLVRALGAVSADDAETQHQLRLAFRMARHLQRRSEIGEVLDDADIDDVHQLLGRRPADWREAERELERFVMIDADTGRFDEALTLLFHRRHLRTHMALGPAGSSMARHYQCQRLSADTDSGVRSAPHRPAVSAARRRRAGPPGRRAGRSARHGRHRAPTRPAPTGAGGGTR
jgi:aminoglycoside phosphotransferase (APT) family kinase protein